MPATATKSKPKSKVTLQPIGDKVVVERDETEEKTAGGIYIPDTAKDKPTRGTIIAVGTGKILDDGSIRKPDVKAGDNVLFAKYSGSEIKIDGEEHLILREDDLLGVVEA